MSAAPTTPGNRREDLAVGLLEQAFLEVRRAGLADASARRNAAAVLADVAGDLDKLSRGEASECPSCGRDACAGDCRGAPRALTTPSVAESLPAFMARVREALAPAWLVRELIPDEGLVVWHGRPRSISR